MSKLKIIIAIILILIPLVLGIIVFLHILGITPFNIQENYVLLAFGANGSPMMALFYGIMLLSGVILLKNKK